MEASMHTSRATSHDHVSAVSAAAALGLRPTTDEPDLFDALRCDGEFATSETPAGFAGMTAAEVDLDDASYARLVRNGASTAVEWTESEIAGLHWELLREVGALSDPKTPIAEKLDTLAWVLRDPKHDDEAFSFANCVRVVSSHVAFEDFIESRQSFHAQLAQQNTTGKSEARRRMPPTAYLGNVDVDTVRLYVQVHARQWLRESLELLPTEAQAFFRARPQYVATRLGSNPQWLNELLAKDRRRQEQGPGLFDGPTEGEAS
jgi:hypothetical protein